MEKKFNLQVPDEIWVNSWEEGKTEEFNYSGPEKIYVKVLNDNSPIDSMFYTEEVEIGEKETLVEVDAVQKPAIAYYFVYEDEIDENSEPEYIEETNHDGSIYYRPKKFELKDYYTIEYDPYEGLYLDPVYKEPTTQAEEEAKRRLDFVKKVDDRFDFDQDTQNLIDSYVSKLENYLESMKTVYPWKYEAIDFNEIPKIPASLMKEIKDLPEIN